MLVFMFGLAGSGKNYVGEILQKKFGYIFWDADEIIPANMRKCIIEKKTVSQTSRNKYIQEIINKVQKIQSQFPNQNICIAQALYKEKTRKKIAAIFPQMLFLEINASLDVTLYRIQQRKNWIGCEYAIKIYPSYEKPQLPHRVIVNEKEGDQLIIQQLLLIPEIISDHSQNKFKKIPNKDNYSSLSPNP